MLPYIGHEIVDVLRSATMDGQSAAKVSAAHASDEPEALVPARRVMPLVLSHLLGMGTSKWMIYIMLICF